VEQLIFAACIGILFGLFGFLNEKRKAETEREWALKKLEEVLTQRSALQTAVKALKQEVSEMRESVKNRDRQEQAIFEGMNNILNYSEAVARKAASGYGGAEEDGD
jgi:Na+-translocating ferredoxin:NAD+ oxidoreductase RnfG subunit